MKISTKQFTTRNLITEQVFADGVQIGLLTKTRGANMPWRAIFLKDGHKLDLGIFKGDIGRRNAKNAIIEKYQK